jgi:hypothetical protein
MTTRTQRKLIDTIKLNWLVKESLDKVRTSKPPAIGRSRLTTTRDGAKSSSRTQFVAHVELSANGAYVVWTTGTKKRGNRWRTRLPLEKLREWDETVRTANVKSLERENAISKLKAAVWEQFAGELTDFQTCWMIESWVTQLIRRGTGKRKQ